MKAAWLYWKMAILHFALFSINALGTSVIASLAGKNWSLLTGSDRFIIGTAIVVNWTGTIMAFLNKSMQTMGNGKSFLSSDTQTFTKTD